MIKTEKILHLKNCRGRKVRVVREHYLRERVPCYSSLCQADCANGKVRHNKATVAHTHTNTHTTGSFVQLQRINDQVHNVDSVTAKSTRSTGAAQV